jgi:hypothetical protein
MGKFDLLYVIKKRKTITRNKRQTPDSLASPQEKAFQPLPAKDIVFLRVEEI